MPTTHLRHQIMETPEIARAIDLAAQRWPGDSRSQLVRRLIAVGATSVDSTRATQHRERLRAIDRTSGAFTAEFGTGYLKELRDDWPS